MLDVWQSSPSGLYENQDPNQEDRNLRGRFRADDEGRYWFRTVKPARYPVPTTRESGAHQLGLHPRTPVGPIHLAVNPPHLDNQLLIVGTNANGVTWDDVAPLSGSGAANY